MPFFSVIIPLYNKAEYISECIESALNQTFEDYEIVIVNDGSTDKSVSIVESFTSDKIELIHQENLGVSIARNTGCTHASGNYLAFLDADDLWKPNHLEALKESIDKFKNAGLYCNNYLINYNKSHTRPAQLNFNLPNQPIIIEDFFKSSLKDTVAWTSATAISKNKFIANGMFNPLYTTGQDLDLWIRMALKDTVVFNPETTMLYKKSIGNSLSKTENNKVRSVLFNSFTEFESENIYLKKYLDLKRYGLALRTKINGESKIYKDTLKTIDFNNLSAKQKGLLNTPAFILKALNKVRPYVIKSKLYLLLFKG
jgi:glycosyltransferase involved in cell wall biosynthesis